MTNNSKDNIHCIEDCLRLHATAIPNKTAVVCGDDSITYQELFEAVSNRSKHYSAAAEKIFCLRATPTIEYLTSYFAIHMAGKVAMPLDKDILEDRLLNIQWQMRQHSVPDGTADILYTTGTTGLSKGVIISHRAWLATAENLIEGQGVHSNLAFVVNGPLNHIGSLSKIFPVIMQGGMLIIVDGLKDIQAFWAAFRINDMPKATFLVPASIRILLQFSADILASLADSIEFIETGAAAISQTDIQHLCQLLPNSRLYNTYASTETGVISTYNFNNGQALQGCLGRPLSRSRIIIDDNGLITCEGDTLMTGYIGDEKHTREVLYDGALHTADLGCLDSDGMLHLMGREDDVINVGGYKVAPTEVEEAALSFPDVMDCICIAIDHPITGKALKLLVVTSTNTILDKHALAIHLKNRLETYKVPQIYEQVNEIQRTFNGKLNRKAYAE